MQRSSDAMTHQHALQQFARLGYTVLDGSQEEHDTFAVTGRQNAGEVVLLSRLHDALRSLNPDCTDDLLEKAVNRITESRTLFSIAEANKQVYEELLRDGIKVDVHGQLIASDISEKSVETSHEDTWKTLRIIDWDQTKTNKNDFVLVSHFWVDGKFGKRCFDLVGFVNGLPLLLLEIADSDLKNIFDRIDQDYKDNVPAFFWYNAFIVVADAFTCKMGSLTTPWEHFFQWKRIRDEDETENTKLSTLIEGTCDKKRFLDILENFTLFESSKGLHKLIARNHQYLGVNNAIASLHTWEQERARRRQAGEPEMHGKLGVFWHTQGSGKSYSMVFFVRKVQRTISNSYTFVVVTDREDLDDQIYKNFRHTSTIVEDANLVHAGTAKRLKQLLGGKHMLLFTLIQKFYSDKPGQDLEEISDNENIVVMVDEAHRTQYDTLARNMRAALPRASFIGFTGTPLMDGEQQTRETFGNYVSIYNFRRAINDSITVPLYYENHTPQIALVNDDFQEEVIEILDDGMLDERQEQRVSECYARAEEIVIKDERLDQVATDIVNHFMTRGYMGKAMVVSINKITAVRTYNRVWQQWKRYREALQAQLAQELDPYIRHELEKNIAFMTHTEMAVIVSASRDDAKRFAKFSKDTGEYVDILYHHRLFKKRKLDEDFKKATHPLRIVFVCGMWMTGFDVPCLSTMYLDRPLKDHTLMQTIARTNRVYEDKNNGLIVDYASNIHAVVKALSVYAREDTSGYHTGDLPIGNKSDLVQTLRERLAGAQQFCEEQGINVQALLVSLAHERDRSRQENLISSAVDALVVYDEIKLRALLLTSEVSRLYKAILPDMGEREFTLPVRLFRLIKNGIYTTMRPTGFRDILGRVTTLVRDSLEVLEPEERLSADTFKPRGSFDLRDIDLNALQTNMHIGHKHIKAEQMRQLLLDYIRRMIDVNPSRVKYMEKLERAIRKYNDGSANVASDPPLIDPQEKITELSMARNEQVQPLDEYLDSLLTLTSEVQQEEQRAEQEELSEVELAFFDLLTLNVALSEQEHIQVKAMVRTLLVALRPSFDVIDWQKKQQMLGRVQTTIEDELRGLAQILHNDEYYKQKCKDVYLYVQVHYKNDGTTSVA